MEDVSFGGVLCALPALAENGPFRRIHDCFKKLSGHYTTLHVIVLLAQMAPCRSKTIEQFQYQRRCGRNIGLLAPATTSTPVRDSPTAEFAEVELTMPNTEHFAIVGASEPANPVATQIPAGPQV